MRSGGRGDHDSAAELYQTPGIGPGQGIVINQNPLVVILRFVSILFVTSKTLRNPRVHDLEHSQPPRVPALGEAPFCMCARNFRRASPAVRTRGPVLRNLVLVGATRSRGGRRVGETETQAGSHKVSDPASCRTLDASDGGNGIARAATEYMCTFDIGT